MKKLLEALRCCHAQGICHRQVRAENVLLKSEGDLSRPVLGGWSLATSTSAASSSADSTPSDDDPLDVTAESADLHYSAPELVGDAAAPGDAASRGPEQDIWALGVLYHILLSGHPPADSEELDDAALRAAITGLEFPPRDADWVKNVTPEGLDFLKRMLTVDPTSRPSAMDLLNDKYMRTSISRATVLETKDLSRFAERRRKKLKRAKTKLKFVVSMIIQANRSKRMLAAITEGAKKEANDEQAPSEPETKDDDAAKTEQTAVTAVHDNADVEDTVLLTDC